MDPYIVVVISYYDLVCVTLGTSAVLCQGANQKATRASAFGHFCTSLDASREACQLPLTSKEHAYGWAYKWTLLGTGFSTSMHASRRRICSPYSVRINK